MGIDISTVKYFTGEVFKNAELVKAKIKVH